jgi:hypothetical protein
MVNFDKAVSIYITTDDDLCSLFIKKFVGLSNLSNIHLELPVGVCIQVKHVRECRMEMYVAACSVLFLNQ